MENLIYKGIEIQINQDIEPQNPRTEWDNLGTMVCFHSRYDLGDNHNFIDPDEFREFAEKNNIVVLPLYLYDHGGITMRTGAFSCPWDSGQVGWIYITKEKIREEYSWKNVTKGRIAKIREYLEGEVGTYDDFLTGNVYGYNVEEANESCWGYYGEPDKSGLLEDAKSVIDYYLEQEQENMKDNHCKQFNALKTRIKAKVSLIYRPSFNEYAIN